MPPNIKTINMLFGTNITKKEEMVAWLNKRRPSSGRVKNILVWFSDRKYLKFQISSSSKLELFQDKKPKNGEEMAISRVGKELYKMLIKPYTKKQWNKYPAQLDAEVFTRLPYREDNDDR